MFPALFLRTENWTPYLLKLKFRKLLEYTDKEKTLHSKLSERLRKEK